METLVRAAGPLAVRAPSSDVRFPASGRSLRVLLLNYEYPPLGGGAAVATAALAAGLAARGATVDVVASRVRGAGAARITFPIAAPAGEAGSVTVHRVASWRRGVHEAGFIGAFTYLLAAWPVVRRLVRTRHYDVVHVFFSLPTGALLPVAGLARTPVVVSLRGSDVPGYDESSRALTAVHALCRPLTRWIWRRADRVTAVCESLAMLARQTEPSLACAIARNGVDLQCFRPPSERCATGGVVRCIAVARLVERKGLADLIRAWSMLDRGTAVLEIVGSGPAGEDLRGLAQRTGVGAEIHFAGSLDREALAERYRESDLFVLLPHEEAFGNVFAEALAAGLPIVATDVGGIPELVTHEENGFLVPPREPAAAARALRVAVGDAAWRARVGARNRERAESALSWDAATARYLALYAELLSARRS